jgi:hypothetical protein
MRQLSFVVFLVAALAACGDNNSGSPDARPRPDGGEDIIDAAGDDDIDAPLAPDANVDAEPPPVDANVDADPGPDVNAQIAAVRAAADDTAIDLPIEGAMVTFLKPAIGNPDNDPAGFTIQGSQAGPAIFVAVDPATLTPAPAIGDTVSFNVTLKDTVGASERATAITGYTRDATGGSVESLVKDISAATDLVTAIGDYDAELIDITGTISAAFGNSGTGFRRALITTTGIPAEDANFQLRVPAPLETDLELGVGCEFTLNNTPVGRFNAQAQVAAFTAGDIDVTCPFNVATASALSSTSVRVTFNRNVDPASILGNGSQFTIAGLTVTAATVTGNNVSLTTTAQTSGAMYTVVVGAGVEDLTGTPLGTPNSAMFGGFVTQAVIRINELNANVGGSTSNSCDQIELRVVSGGLMTGYVLRERTGGAGELNFTFPAFSVATNDIIVVHNASGNATCNPGGATAETTSPTEQLAATFGGNYDTAYDFWDVDAGLTNTDNVFTLRNAAGDIIDAVFCTEEVTGSAAGATEAAAALVVTAAQWENNDGTVPAGGYLDDVFSANAAMDLNGTDLTAGGTSIQRLDNTDDDNTADWNDATTTVQPNTFGALNPGQTAF